MLHTIHVNTGTHGNKEGETIYNKPLVGDLAEGRFFDFDYSTLSKHKNVSLHSVSSLAPALYPSQAAHVIDAWCNSSKNPQIKVST
jgi:hypothetical protein